MPAESVSHPGDVQDVKFPTHVHFTKSNSRGLTAHTPPPPNLSLGQTIQVIKHEQKCKNALQIMSLAAYASETNNLPEKQLKRAWKRHWEGSRKCNGGSSS